MYSCAGILELWEKLPLPLPRECPPFYLGIWFPHSLSTIFREPCDFCETLEELPGLSAFSSVKQKSQVTVCTALGSYQGLFQALHFLINLSQLPSGMTPLLPSCCGREDQNREVKKFAWNRTQGTIRTPTQASGLQTRAQPPCGSTLLLTLGGTESFLS